MPARRVTRHDDSAGVDVVGFGVLENPTQRTPRVFHRSRCERDAPQPILHVHRDKPVRHIRHQPKRSSFLAAAYPSTTMKVDHRRLWAVGTQRPVDVEFDLEVVGREVRDIGIDPIVPREIEGPLCVLVELGVGGQRGHAEGNGKQPDDWTNATCHEFLSTVWFAQMISRACNRTIEDDRGRNRFKVVLDRPCSSSFVFIFPPSPSTPRTSSPRPAPG